MTIDTPTVDAASRTAAAMQPYAPPSTGAPIDLRLDANEGRSPHAASMSRGLSRNSGRRRCAGTRTQRRSSG